MEDPFNYVQPQNEHKPQPINVPLDSQPVQQNNSLQKQAKYKKIALMVVISVVVVFSIAAIAVVFFSKDEPEPATSSQPEAPAAEPAPQITKETETYSSAQFFLSFTHPADWTVEEVNGSDELTLTSPQLSLPGETAQLQGIIQMSIRKPDAKLEEFEAGNALAVVPSQKITYTKPSSAQRGDTYVSYLSYASPAATSLIDGVYITGDFGYKQDQAVPKVDIQKINPIIHFRFYACDGECSEPAGVGRDLPDSEAGLAVLDILKSLNIR